MSLDIAAIQNYIDELESASTTIKNAVVAVVQAVLNQTAVDISTLFNSSQQSISSKGQTACNESLKPIEGALHIKTIELTSTTGAQSLFTLKKDCRIIDIEVQSLDSLTITDGTETLISTDNAFGTTGFSTSGTPWGGYVGNMKLPYALNNSQKTFYATGATGGFKIKANVTWVDNGDGTEGIS